MKKVLLLLTTLICITFSLYAREKPRSYIEQAIQLFKVLGGKVIVELGTMGQLTHDIDKEECPYCMSGHSTILWARTLADVYTVDINSNAIDLTKNACKHFHNVYPVNDDGIDFLHNFDKKIDLLYLDAWDVIPGSDYAEKHLEAYLAAKDKLNLTSIILIDDTDIENGGKGRLIIPKAVEDGFKIVFTGRQTMLLRFEIE